jgi:hypothetical protein
VGDDHGAVAEAAAAGERTAVQVVARRERGAVHVEPPDRALRRACGGVAGEAHAHERAARRLRPRLERVAPRGVRLVGGQALPPATVAPLEDHRAPGPAGPELAADQSAAAAKHVEARLGRGDDAGLGGLGGLGRCIGQRHAGCGEGKRARGHSRADAQLGLRSQNITSESCLREGARQRPRRRRRTPRRATVSRRLLPQPPRGTRGDPAIEQLFAQGMEAARAPV